MELQSAKISHESHDVQSDAPKLFEIKSASRKAGNMSAVLCRKPNGIAQPLAIYHDQYVNPGM